MKKIMFFGLPAAVLICGFSIRALLPQKPTLLNHVALHVYNLQKSSLFYEQVVQLDTVPEPFHDGNHTWLKIGEISKLHLIGGAAKDSIHDKNSHLCFSVPSVDDFIHRLEAAHVPYENWAGAKSTFTKRIDGVKQVYFQDPDGYWVEINDDYK